jgi:hypothetical protein
MGPELFARHYMRVNLTRLRLSVGEKKFLKNNQKIDEIHLGT